MALLPRLRPVTAGAAAPYEKPIRASAVRMQHDGGGALQDPYAKRTRLPWQERAFAYYELLGEIWYAAQFYARALAKLELRLVRQTGQDDFEDVEDPDLLVYLDRIQDPGGGRSNLLGSYGRLKFLTGECYLLVTQEADAPQGDAGEGIDEGSGEGVEVWEMLSCDELRWDATGGCYKRYRLPNTTPEVLEETPAGVWEPIPETAIAYRFWTRHPRFSNLPDAPMRGVLDLCEELVILTRVVRARGRSRLTGSGVLWVPNEISFDSDDAGDPQEDPSKNPFQARLQAAMVAGLADEGNASSVVPIVVDANADLIEKVRHMTFFDPAQVYPETGLRAECIQRIAIGLDLPPEILLGKGGANHWSAWQIDEDSWKAHLQPVAQSLVDDLTGGYLRPSLRAAGIADWDSYSIAYDASAIIQHPDRARDARDLWDRGAISWDALRFAAGFDDDDGMDEEEFRRWVGIKLGDASLATGGEITAPAAPPEPPAPTGEGEDPAAVEEGPPPEGDEEEESEIAAPGTTEEADGKRIVVLASALVAERARELAGSRLRTRFGRRYATALDGVHNRDVPARLAEVANGELDAVAAERHNLVAGAGECFRPRLLALGLGAGDVDMLLALAEQTAAETLFDAVGA